MHYIKPQTKHPYVPCSKPNTHTHLPDAPEARARALRTAGRRNMALGRAGAAVAVPVRVRVPVAVAAPAAAGLYKQPEHTGRRARGHLGAAPAAPPARSPRPPARGGRARPGPGPGPAPPVRRRRGPRRAPAVTCSEAAGPSPRSRYGGRFGSFRRRFGSFRPPPSALSAAASVISVTRTLGNLRSWQLRVFPPPPAEPSRPPSRMRAPPSDVLAPFRCRPGGGGGGVRTWKGQFLL